MLKNPKKERIQQKWNSGKRENTFHYYAEQNEYGRVQEYTPFVERRNMLFGKHLEIVY